MGVISGENLFLNVHGKNLRASRDWVGDRWVDIETNATIISAISAAISPDTKLSTTSTIDEAKSDEILTSGHEVLTNVKIVEEEKLDLACLAHRDGIPENMKVDVACLSLQDGTPENMNCSHEEEVRLRDKDKVSTGNLVSNSHEKNFADCIRNNSDNKTSEDLDEDGNANRIEIEMEGSETFAKKCEPEQMEVVA